jgi:hypothetical protein
LFVTVVHGVDWTANSPPDGTELYVCRDTTVTFPWGYLLAGGDEVVAITWLYVGHSHEMVAMFSHGTFLPTPAFR